MAHCVVSGITGCRNRGAEALVVSTVEQVRVRRADMESRVLTLRPEEDAVALRDLKGAKFFPAIASGKDVWRHRAARLLTPRLSPLGDAMEGAELLIISGGDLFGPDYGASGVKFGAWPGKVAAAFGVPYALQAQSVGPFRDVETAKLFAECAKGAHHIAVRETITRDYLKKEFSIEESRLPLVADPAFLLAPTGDASALLAKCGIAAGEPFIALCASRSLTGLRGVAPKALAEAWASIARHALAKWDRRVLFVPHVKESEDAGNDGATAREAAALVGDARVSVADESHRASEFKSMLARADFVVSQRAHAAIAALSSGVPTAVIGYSVKFPGIVGGVLGRDARAEGLAFPWEDLLERNAEVLAALDRAWNRRAEISGWIAEHLPGQIRNANLGFDLLMEAARRR